MKPKLVDIHCHLDFPEFDEDREDVIKRTLNGGLWFITIGTYLSTSKKALEIAQEHAGVFASAGLHPQYMGEGFNKGDYEQIARDGRVVAIGECGLDYRRIADRDAWAKKEQKELFKKQIELAIELGKPLMIHCRDAHDDMLTLLKYYSGDKLKGNIHFFSGGLDEVREYLALGFMISFAGPITFDNRQDDVVKAVPLERMMIETDAPFVAPAAYRGKRCEPLYVEEVAKKIAEVKGISFEEVAGQTTENAINFFRLG